MKIIQVMPFFGIGGAETMCENLVYELVKMGHEVIVLSLYNKHTAITDRFENSGIDIRYLNKNDGLDFSMLKKLSAIFRQEKPHVIHTHIYSTKYVFPVAKALGIKVVHTVHSVAKKEATRLSRKYNGIFYKYFDVTPVALSDAVKDTILEEYKLKSEKVPIVLNGINLENCTSKTDYSIKDNFIIVHVGSFLEVKNHIGLIDAFEIFNKKYPESELWLIGDGDRRVWIEKIVDDKKLSNSVRFFGLQSNVFQFLKDADVFTLPSLYEGVPMSIVEAMGTGLPIVATEVGGIPDMLNKDSALLVEVNVESIAKAFEKYYTSEDLRKQHGENALLLSGRFSSAMMAKKYCEIYENNRRNS